MLPLSVNRKWSRGVVYRGQQQSVKWTEERKRAGIMLYTRVLITWVRCGAGWSSHSTSAKTALMMRCTHWPPALCRRSSTWIMWRMQSPRWPEREPLPPTHPPTMIADSSMLSWMLLLHVETLAHENNGGREVGTLLQFISNWVDMSTDGTPIFSLGAINFSYVLSLLSAGQRMWRTTGSVITTNSY